MRLSFDIGGTFTDVIGLEDDGSLRTTKVLSLLDRVGHDINAFVDAPTDEPRRVELYVHATTICSNALIEGTLPPIALITTAGFRDALELANQKGPLAASIEWEPPTPLVPRQRRYEVGGRILADGTIDRPLPEDQCRVLIRRIAATGVKAVAISLINSYVNGEHERQLKAWCNEEAPQLRVDLSSAVHPEIREYERTSTTVINTALVPVVARYLDMLEADLSSHRGPIVIMQSNGGIMSSEAARNRPMLMVESGPAAGVLAAAKLAQALDVEHALSFDVGGTTAKACLIVDGAPLERTGGVVGAAVTVGGRSRDAGHVLRVPTLDLVEVGAGGGSLAWAEHGVLRVGPQSAGADPGPACYGRGGSKPTVTDANVVLGNINPHAIAGGRLAIDRDAAESALRPLAADLSLSVPDLAFGVTRVANAVMMRALRAVTTERGHDPRRCVLVAYGGGGPLHGCALAGMLGITRVMVPPLPGLFSAFGLHLADYRVDLIRSVASPLAEVPVGLIEKEFDSLESEAADQLNAFRPGTPGVRFHRQIDMRYDYQVEELTVDLSRTATGTALLDQLRRAFVDAHRREFGFDGRGQQTVVNLRLQAIAPSDGVELRAVTGLLHGDDGAPRTSRSVYFGPEEGFRQTAIRTRASIGSEERGPMLIEEVDSTVVVPPGWSVRRDETWTLLLSRDAD
jgi:N-methylhydantoinase A